MSANAIRVQSVSKRYEVFANQRSRLLHAVWPAHRDGVEEVWALSDVSFEVARGESLAVIGRNGGGKSTLLQILTGVLEPTAGAVEVNGRVCALLELGSGFHPEYTGRENVILNGLLLGLSREEILGRFDEIADFAEIGAAIERPVKTYSSGMLVRLAFAVQVLTDPEILVVDEALSVGDFFFQQKCFGRIRALREKGLTLVFVSHDLGAVRDLCSRALYLREGRLAFVGDVHTAVRRYLAQGASDHPAAAQAPPAAAGAEDAGSAIWTKAPVPGTASLVAVELLRGGGALAVALGDTLAVQVHFWSPADDPLHVSLLFKNRYDQLVTSVSTFTSGLPPAAPDGEGRGIVQFDISMMLEAGLYAIKAVLARPSGSNQGSVVDETEWLGPVSVNWDYERDTAPFLGMFGLPVHTQLLAGVAGPPRLRP